jgi:hypothetical protein
MSLPEIDHDSDKPSINSADYNDQLADKITTLAGQINAVNYRFFKLITEFDRREAWSAAGIRSFAHWLNWKCSIATVENKPHLLMIAEHGTAQHMEILRSIVV